MRALVSAAEVLAIVTTHLDRLHDAALRLGCPAAEAPATAQAAAAELVDDLATRPETVGDLVGGLYARCREIAGRIPPADLTVAGTGPLGGDREAEAVAAALAALPADRRLAVLLIDAYAVTYGQSSVALSLDVAETARSVALGRAELVAGVDGRQTPELAGHDVAVGDLGQLSDGSAPAGGRFAGLRKHVSACALCAETLAIQTRGKAMLAALPVLALPDADRATALTALARDAGEALPSADEVAAELDGEVDRSPLVPWWLWVSALLVALLLGAGLGLLLRGQHGSSSVAVRSAPVPVSSVTPSIASTTTSAAATLPAAIATPPTTASTIPSSRTGPDSTRARSGSTSRPAPTGPTTPTASPTPTPVTATSGGTAASASFEQTS